MEVTDILDNIVSPNPDMKYSIRLSCLFCDKTPYYGLNRLQPLTCLGHKDDTYVRCRKGTCICGKIASYKDTIFKIYYCAKHKNDNCKRMYIPKKTSYHRLCACGKRARCGPIGSPAITCKDCKQTDYIEFDRKLCACGKEASYGTERNKPLTCKQHKEVGYIRVTGRVCSCGKWPSFGPIGGKPISCKTCKEDNHIKLCR